MPRLRPVEWVSITVFAARFGVDRHTVYKWMDEGLLEYYRVKRLIRIKNRRPPHRPLDDARP